MPVARLCATVVADTSSELRRQRDAAHAVGADLVELRLDAVHDPDVAAVLAKRPCEVIVTCRPTWEGGRFRGSEEERCRLLGQAAALGAEYVDIEWRTLRRDSLDRLLRDSGARRGTPDSPSLSTNASVAEIVAARRGRGVILSMHDFEGVPADLGAQLHAMRATGAEVVKIATTAKRLTDVVPLLALARHAQESPLVLVAMGMPGVVTRIAAARFGSAWSYAGDAIAPGQLTAERLLHEFRFKTTRAGTKLYGIVGRPVGHSLSPVMHNHAFETIGRDAVYVPFEAADADDFLSFAEALGIEGVSVTAPFKRDLFERAARVDDLSRRVGATNTLCRDCDGWSATNTDVPGFLAPLEGRGDVRDARVAVIGAGGAARAVVIAVERLTPHITVYARDVRRATAVAALAGAAAAPLPPPPGSWDLLVNATPVGTAPRVDETPVPADRLDGRLVYDLVYNPMRTRLLADATAAGCETIGGLEMLVAQARQQFARWTGCQLSAEVFREAAARGLGQSGGPSESSRSSGSSGTDQTRSTYSTHSTHST